MVWEGNVTVLKLLWFGQRWWQDHAVADLQQQKLCHFLAKGRWNVQHRECVIRKGGDLVPQTQGHFICILMWTIMEKCLAGIRYCYR